MLPKKKRWMADVHNPTLSNSSLAHVQSQSTVSGHRKPSPELNAQPFTSVSRPTITTSMTATNVPSSVKNVSTGSYLPNNPHNLTTAHHNNMGITVNSGGSGDSTLTDPLSMDAKHVQNVLRQPQRTTKNTLSRRNESPMSIPSMTQYPPELLQQQPGFLLQVLPQEYLANCVQAFAKLASGKAPSDGIIFNSGVQLTESPAMKPRSETTVSVPNSQFNSSHLTDMHEHLINSTSQPSPALPNSISRSKAVDNSKVRNYQTLRSSPMPNPPVFQCPPAASHQRFSPGRHQSGPGDLVAPSPGATKTRAPSHQLPQQQQQPIPNQGLDFSTVSAVARAASLFSPTQLEAARVLISQLDSAGQLSLLTNSHVHRDMGPVTDLASHKHNTSVMGYASVSTAPPSVNTTILNSHVASRPGLVFDSKSKKYPEPAFTSPRQTTCVASSTIASSDIKNIALKPSVPISRTHAIPATQQPDLNKSSHLPIWNSEFKSDPIYTYPNGTRILGSRDPSFLESTGSRLAILHDAKMASMSMDWPPGAINPNLSKINRIRSSSSFSSVVCPSTTGTPTTFSQSHANFVSPPVLHTRNIDKKPQLPIPLTGCQIGSTTTSDPLSRSALVIQHNLPVSTIGNPAKNFIPHSSITAISNSIDIKPSVSTANDVSRSDLCPGPPPSHFTPRDAQPSLQVCPPTQTGHTSTTEKLEADPHSWTLKRPEYDIHPNRKCSGNVVFQPPVQLKTEEIEVKLPENTNSELKLQNAVCSSSSMPLKKRLMQRYEADREDEPPGPVQESLLCSNPELSEFPDLKIKVTTDVDVLDSSSSSIRIPSLESLKSRDENGSETTESTGIHNKLSKRPKYGSASESSRTKSTDKISNKPSTGLRKKKTGSSRKSKSLKCDDDESSQSENPNHSKAATGRNDSLNTKSRSGSKRQSTVRRARKHSSSTSSTASLIRNSSRSESTRPNTSRRIAAVNGKLLMMVTAQAQRSTSSGSSSSSLRSMDADETDTEHHNHSANDNVPGSPHSSCHSKTSTDRLTNYCRRNMSKLGSHHIQASPITHSFTPAGSPATQSSVESMTTGTTDGPRKPKRAAALAASAATAASAVVSSKKPRLMVTSRKVSTRNKSSTNPQGLRRKSLEAEEIRSNHSDNTPIEHATNDEVSAILAEEHANLDELARLLPGPPDLIRTANKSLHAAHSLNFYKRSQRVFVQLVSCNDPGLKQVPKCRACRQVKSSRGNDSQINEDDHSPTGLMNGDVESQESLSSTVRTNRKETSFKRPWRGTSSDRVKRRDGQTEKSKTKRHITDPPVSIFCRFWGFRKLCFNNRGVLKQADFCQSNEADSTERCLWEMHHPISPHLSLAAARYIVECAGPLFCQLLHQERSLLVGKGFELLHSKQNTIESKNGICRSTLGSLTSGATRMGVAWKRPVKGVREMCDVCETTMFNTHWVCAKCGYSVCIDCVDEAKCASSSTSQSENSESRTSSEQTSGDKARTRQSRARGGPTGWVSCTTTRQHHEPQKLVLTSLIPSGIIGKLFHRLHRIAAYKGIPLHCPCSDYGPNSNLKSQQENRLVVDDGEQPVNRNSLDLLADLALKTDGTVGNTHVQKLSPSQHSWIASGVRNNFSPTSNDQPTNPTKYRVLRFRHPDVGDIMNAFQSEWRQNRPIIISGCERKFTKALWTPRSFSEDFGQLRTTLVDCATGNELTRYPMRSFWDGFEKKEKRITNKDGRSLCLKLKDWPTTDDFAELQPKRFADLMNNLPMPDYTCRDGQFNLAARLASFFVCPDLGPKLYVAYGTIGSRSLSTTNLHMDIADAVNVLLYVGHLTDNEEERIENAESILDILRQSHVDPSYLERSRSWLNRLQLPRTCSDQDCDFDNSSSSSSNIKQDPKDHDIPGALWHIFLPEDTAILRKFLVQLSEDQTNSPMEAGSDPIHDQLFYLDQPLLDQLYACSGVQPCCLVQFPGDAIFIPAGSAHQVRNLNSCIKAAVDFVSPEHLQQCFQLIDEFRRLSATHQNHEDKLQVKNMLFHGVKDALSVILTSDDDSISSKSSVVSPSLVNRSTLGLDNKLEQQQQELSNPINRVTSPGLSENSTPTKSKNKSNRPKPVISISSESDRKFTLIMSRPPNSNGHPIPNNCASLKTKSDLISFQSHPTPNLSPHDKSLDHSSIPLCIGGGFSVGSSSNNSNNGSAHNTTSRTPNNELPLSVEPTNRCDQHSSFSNHTQIERSDSSLSHNPDHLGSKHVRTLHSNNPVGFRMNSV